MGYGLQYLNYIYEFSFSFFFVEYIMIDGLEPFFPLVPPVGKGGGG